MAQQTRPVSDIQVEVRVAARKGIGTHIWDQDACDCGHGYASVYQLGLHKPPPIFFVSREAKRVEPAATASQEPENRHKAETASADCYLPEVAW